MMDAMDFKIEKKRGLRPKHFIYLVGGAILIFLIVKIIGGEHTSRYKIDKDKVTIDEVFFGDFKDYTDITGQVLIT